MPIYDNIVATIGNTPVIKVQHIDTGPCELYLKLENQNPGGSVKDRIALHMIEQAEKRGELKPGATIIEGTAGNTGLSLALVALSKGYHCIIVMPDKMSKEKIAHLKALGAEVIMTRSDVVKGHPEYYLDLAERLTQETENSYYINQFGNPDNVAAHATITGPEIWQDMQQDLDVFVAGMGTSGTLSGVGQYLRSMNNNIKLILADPQGSILADYVNNRVMGEAASWLVEGIGEDYIPSISQVNNVDQAITVQDIDAFNTARELLRKEGIFAGSSSGTLVHAAIQYCRAQTQPKRVLTLVCDTGNKYLSKLYDDAWMCTQGFFNEPGYGDLRDLLCYASCAQLHIDSSLPMLTAHKRLLEYRVTQLPVLNGKRCVGVLSDADLLAALEHDKEALTQPIENYMHSEIQCLDKTADEARLAVALAQSPAVVITDNDNFCGMLTRLDYANALKRRG